MKKWMTLLVAATLAGSVYGANLDQGTYELLLNGSLDFDTAADTQFQTDLGLGYFVIDNVEAGGQLGVFDNDQETRFSLGAFGEYNFDLGSPVVPFAGGGLSYVNAEIERPGKNLSQDVVDVSVFGGAKYFITEDLAIAAQLELHIASDDIYANKDTLDNTNWLLSWGLRYFFDL